MTSQDFYSFDNSFHLFRAQFSHNNCYQGQIPQRMYENAYRPQSRTPHWKVQSILARVHEYIYHLFAILAFSSRGARNNKYNESL